MTKPRKQIHLAAHFPGVNNTTVWSDPAAGSQIDFASFVHFAQTAERGKFDFFFLAEGLRLREQSGQIYDLDVVGRPDTFTVLAALAAVTDRLGLAGTINSTFNEPYELARQFATPRPPLRRPGRAGTWSPRGTRSPARTSAAAASSPQDERYDRAEEFLRHRARAVRLLARRRDRRRPGSRASSCADARRRARSPTTATQFDIARPVQRAAQPAGPPGDLPGRRLRRGPRVRRRRRRRDLHPARHAGGGPGVLRRRQGPARQVRPHARRAEDPARGDVRARRHRRRGRRRRPARSAASRSAAQTAIKFARAAVEPRPVRPTTPTARCPTSTRSSARTPSPRAGPACGCTATRWPPRSEWRELAEAKKLSHPRAGHRDDRPADLRRHPGHGRRRRSTTSCRPTPATASSSSRTSPRAASTTFVDTVVPLLQERGRLPHRVRGHDAARAPRPARRWTGRRDRRGRRGVPGRDGRGRHARSRSSPRSPTGTRTGRRSARSHRCR